MSLRPCALDESSLSIGRVDKYGQRLMTGSITPGVQMNATLTISKSGPWHLYEKFKYNRCLLNTHHSFVDIV